MGTWGENVRDEDPGVPNNALPLDQVIASQGFQNKDSRQEIKLRL